MTTRKIKGKDSWSNQDSKNIEQVRVDVESGLRFNHLLSMQMKQDLYDSVTQMSALIDELVSNGTIQRSQLEDRYERSREREYLRIREHAYVKIAEPRSEGDQGKAVTIDCAERLSLCKARCCTFGVTLSTEDLDKGQVQWDYAEPYRVRLDTDGYCTHSCKGEGGGCEVYAHRPSACRDYDCRLDERIWADFDLRIPAA
jgi:Fe-S-cluster containining protein